MKATFHLEKEQTKGKLEWEQIDSEDESARYICDVFLNGKQYTIGTPLSPCYESSKLLFRMVLKMETESPKV